MTKYLILIYEDEAGYASASPEVFDEIMQAHNQFTAQVEELMTYGARLVHDLDYASGVWTAVCEVD